MPGLEHVLFGLSNKAALFSGFHPNVFLISEQNLRSWVVQQVFEDIVLLYRPHISALRVTDESFLLNMWQSNRHYYCSHNYIKQP